MILDRPGSSAIPDDDWRPVPCTMREEIAWRKANPGGYVVALDSDVVPGVNVSTVFLSSDHSFGGYVPIHFETMVFGGSLDLSCERYATVEAARKGHAWWVAKVKAAGDI